MSIHEESNPSRSRPEAKRREADAESDLELVDRLTDIYERTVAPNGPEASLQVIRDLLTRLTRVQLQGLIRELGFESPEEMTEVPPDGRTGSNA